jgi:hypothetical protein
MKREFFVEREGRSFVLYAGLLDLAHERGLRGITTTLVQVPSELNGSTAIVHATVETEDGTYTGLGDASPSNVTRMMAPHLIRMAETRAKARALRDAVNVGVTAFEELGDDSQDGDRKADPVVPVNGARRPALVDERGRPDGAAIEAEAERRGPISTGERVNIGFGVNREDGPATAAPATPKQINTIQRMARAGGKTIETEGLSRAQASEIISGLIGELGQLRAN